VTDFPHNSSLRRAAALSLVLSLVILAAGCGRRGPLEPPATAAVTSTPTPAPTTGADPTAALGHPKVAPIKPPKTPFVLDPLL
jgi:predicted small lipoprotein YifL